MYPRYLLTLAASAWLSACGGAPEARTGGGDLLPIACLDKPDSGVCGKVTTAYYYEYRSDRCQPFSWGGCGSKVPFRSVDDCVKTCGGRPAP